MVYQRSLRSVDASTIDSFSLEFAHSLYLTRFGL